MKKATKKGNVVSVDFKGVQAGGGSRLLPEGPNLLEVVGIEQEEGADSGQPYLAIEFEVVDGEASGSKVWDNMSLSAKALWKLRGFLEALGVETEDSVMSLDLDGLIGMVCIGHIAHEEYKGKTKNRVVGYEPAEEPETVSTKEPKSAKKKPKVEDEEAEEPGDDEYLGQKVSFKDGRKKLTGKVVGINGDTLTVDVDGEEYELESSELV